MKSNKLVTNRKVYSIMSWGAHVGGFSRIAKLLFFFVGGFTSKWFQDKLTSKLFKYIDGDKKPQKDEVNDSRNDAQPSLLEKAEVSFKSRKSVDKTRKKRFFD